MIRLFTFLIVVSCSRTLVQNVDPGSLDRICKSIDPQLNKDLINVLKEKKYQHKKWYLVGRCYQQIRNDHKTSYYFDKQDFSKLETSEQGKVVYYRALKSLENFALLEYERLRRGFKKYTSEDFSLLELHYYLMFSKLVDARAIIRDMKKRDVYFARRSFYEAWFLAQVGKYGKSALLLDEVYDEDNKSHALLKSFLDNVLKSKKNVNVQDLSKKISFKDFELNYFESLK